jgi:hypothetical protein
MEKENFVNLIGSVLFFLYSGNEIEENYINPIINEEYETYTINDILNLEKLAEKYKKIILFIDHDKILKNPEIEKDIFKFNKFRTDKIKIVIFSKTGKNNLLIKPYVELYIDLNKNHKENINIILKYLDAIKANGRRKHIRVNCRAKDNAKFSIKQNGRIYSGKLDDISAAAALFNFDDKDIQLEVKSKFDNINLSINGFDFRVSGTILRDQVGFDENLYVILFDEEKLNNVIKTFIRKFIYDRLQEEIQEIIANL